MALDRRPLATTPGLTFSKLVGTGDGRTFTVRDSDPYRWGLVAVWDHPRSLERFERHSRVMAAWSSITSEQWRGELRLLRSRGRWSQREPFGPVIDDAPVDSPIAAVTRARLEWRQARRFWASVPPVSQDLGRQAGLRYAIGFGEAPVGLQGTFSIWDSQQALAAFAYAGQAHRDAITNTHRLQWYREELFARFAIIGSHGTVDGVDPVTARPETPPPGTAAHA